MWTTASPGRPNPRRSRFDVEPKARLLSPRLLAVGAILLVALLLATLAIKHFAPGPAPAPQPEAARSAGFRAGLFDPPHDAPDFALPGSDGSEVSLKRYRGKVVLRTFGFTHCAAVCPTTLATLAQARSRLGKAADGVQVIYVTVDPGATMPPICARIWRPSIRASSARPGRRRPWPRSSGNTA